MTVNSKKVLDFLKANGVGVKFTAKEIQTALGFEKIGSVSGAFLSFTKKGLVDKVSETRTINGETKDVSVYWLTDKGATYTE